MKAYVVGFFFDMAENKIALIKKNRPAWQSGLLNGIGGHIEDDERPEMAMRREFCEETGLVVTDWVNTVVLVFPYAIVYFFKAYGSVKMLKTVTDEEVIIIDYDKLPHGRMIANLNWLIPLMQDNIQWPIMIYSSECPDEG